MGSKVSSKMAAPTARVIQVVRPHAPLIKFPNRQGVARPNVQEALKTLAVMLQQHSAPSSSPPPVSSSPVSSPVSSRPLSSPMSSLSSPLSPLPGSPDTLASVQLLPARYRRRPLTAQEMDYIQRGGPE